jgi:hypothetical protein
MSPLIAALVLLVQSQAANPDLGYRFTIPAGFTDFPEGRRSGQDVVECWSEESAEHGLVLCISRMRGVIPREAMKQSELPAGTELRAFKWKGFDIQGLHSLQAQAGERVSVLVAQVPLRKEAVQVFFGGPEDQGARAQTLMQSLLATFEGETNWLTSEQRAGRWGNIVGWWVGIAIAVVIVVMWRKRRAAKA